MPTLDLPSVSVSRTMPQGIHLLDPNQVAESAPGTPRFGWINETSRTFGISGHRFFVEGLLADLDEEGEAPRGLTTSRETDPGIAWIEPLATGTTGAGYRSPYRISYRDKCAPLLNQLADWQQEIYSATLFQDTLATKYASSACLVLKETLLGNLGEWLLSELQNAYSTLHERMLEEVKASKTEGLKEQDFAAETHGRTANPGVEHETHIGAIRWLEEHACLSQGAIADLVGVSRQTVQNWLKGDSIRDENRRRLLAVREVLQRVQRRHQGEDAIKTWLDTPSGLDGRTPGQLLAANEIGKARALALSTASPPPRTAPEWMRESPADQWTQRQRRRRERTQPDPMDVGLNGDMVDE